MTKIVDLLRTAWVIVVALVATFYTSTLVIIIAHRNPLSPAIDRAIRRWSRTWLRAGGVELTVEGAEAVEPGSYVIVSNHRSNFDIMANFLMLDLPIRFLAKKELFEIMVVGRAMRAIGMVEVDREHGAQIHRQLNESAGKVLHEARSLMVYPEGTRSRDGSMQIFKRGAFAIAIESQMPVLPVAIHGSFEAWPAKGLVKGGRIHVVIGTPVPTAGMQRPQARALADEVRQWIQETLERLEAAGVSRR